MSYLGDPELEDVVTSKDLSEFLGISELSLARVRGLPSIRIGENTLYFKQTVVEWLKAREAVGSPRTAANAKRDS
jgi:hypothetical protein